LILANETFLGTYPFAPNFLQLNSERMHYIDQGAGDPILCLHGEPTWSYLYREMIGPLARHHRVVAPDYLGFGKSDNRTSRTYTTAGHIEDVERLLLTLDLQDITAVFHDWGGPIGGAVVMKHPERFKRLILMNTILPLGLPLEAPLLTKNVEESDWFTWASRAYRDRTFEPTLRNSGVTIVGLMKRLQGFVRTNIDGEFFRAYSQPFATPDECDGVIAFPRSILEKTERPTVFAAELVEKLQKIPAMMIYGMQDRALLPEYIIPIFEEAFPQAPVYRFEQAGHFLQEDIPAEIVELIEQFCSTEEERCSK
jgi:haloalkane dehalogenase